eukprot:CCRYP_015759-RA/>CCRYP_015759-RA protein AED:0.31 eAED:0.31 QI:0/0/0/1/0/0/3/0/812
MERQLNLLRQSNANPKISAYAHLYGPHDYNAAPFVPLGMEALVHDKPHRRKTSPNTAQEIWSPTTRSTRIAATVFFKHKYLTNPSVTPTDALIAAAANLAHIIKHNAKAQHVGTKNLLDLQRLQQLFSDAAQQPPGTSNCKRTRRYARPPPRVQTQTPIPTAWPRPSTSHVISDDEDSDDETAPPPRVPTRRPSPAHLTSSPPLHHQPSTLVSRTRSITHETMLHFLATHHAGITAAKATQRRYPPDMLHAVLNDETGELMEYRHLIANPKYRDTWQNAYGKELGRLAQGLPGIVKGTDTIAFIQRSHVPQDRWKDVTYGRIVANFRPEKEDPYRIRLTVGGNRINYPGDCGTPTADMITVKILLNSVISTLNAKFMTIDIKDFYLNTPMARPEYMRLKLSDIPAAIIDLYKLRDIAQDGYVFVRIQKGMYGLPQAGIIAQQLLEQRLHHHMFRPASPPPCRLQTTTHSLTGALHDPFHSTTKPSTKVFLLPTGGTAQATHISQLMLNVRAPANQVDIVPTLTQTLLSGSKFADAGYTAVYDKDEVNFYDSNKIHVNATSILQGYRCPHTGLWRVPLHQITRNINNDTLILYSPCGTKSLNTKYVVPSTEEIRALLASSGTREQHSILNVYELPSIQQTIRYLHAAAGFPAKTTWMAAIRHGNYNTWPLVTVANVHKHFPQSEETQQGHMRSQRQGVRSTKTTRHAPPTIPAHTAPSLPHHNIFVKTSRHRDTVYSDQTGQFPHVSSRGYRYQMILYHTDSNSIWVEPTKNRTEGELILARTRALSVCEHVDSHQSAKSSTMKHPQHTSKPS